MERTNWVQDFEQHPGQWSLFCNWQGNSEHSNHIKQEIQIIINKISTSKLLGLEKSDGITSFNMRKFFMLIAGLKMPLNQKAFIRRISQHINVN
jgi:hypothetical protein